MHKPVPIKVADAELPIPSVRVVVWHIVCVRLSEGRVCERREGEGAVVTKVLVSCRCLAAVLGAVPVVNEDIEIACEWHGKAQPGGASPCGKSDVCVCADEALAPS